jgi:hypothetical protein
MEIIDRFAAGFEKGADIVGPPEDRKRYLPVLSVVAVNE